MLSGTKGLLGALAFGGYHANRIVPHAYQFPFYSDTEAALTLSVREMSLSNSNGSQIFTSPPFPAAVDSTRPYIYLPGNAYESILRSLQLKLDPSSNHVLITNKQHASLLNQNFSLNFMLVSYADAGSKSAIPVNISLPYSSLAMKLSYPYVPAANDTWYLPIRMGNESDSNSNYVLGRTFLQEAYLIANYDKNYFKVHQVNWTTADPSKDSIMPIDLDVTSLSKNVIIAAAVAGTVVFLLLVFLFSCFILRRRRRQQKKLEKEQILTSPTSSGDRESKLMEADSATVHEMPSSVVVEPVEMDGKNAVSEMPDYNGTLGTHYKPVELDPTEKIVFEMEGSPGDWKEDRKEVIPSIERQLDINTPAAVSDESGIMTGSGTTSASSMSTSGVSSLDTHANINSNSSSNIFSSGLGSLPKSRLPRVTVVPAPGLSTGQRSEQIIPASPIPQTPLEYYGGKIPEPRMNRALQRLRAAERGELPIDVVRNAGIPLPAGPKVPANASSMLPKPTKGKGEQKATADSALADRIIDSSGRSRSISLEKLPENGSVIGTSNIKAVKLPLQVPQTSSPLSASPIPQTPLEFYGKAPGIQGPQSDREWIGRAPEAPTVNLIPATPLASDPIMSLRPRVERREEDMKPPPKKM